MAGRVPTLAVMRTVTVELSDEVADKAEVVAAERGVSVAELAREAIEVRLSVGGGHRFGFVAIAATGDTDLSESYKAIRRAEFD